MESLKIYLVRHGETKWNVERKFQGQLNSPLTEKGIEKIEKLGKTLENVTFDEVYTSQMGRTIETAQIVLQFNKNELEKAQKTQLQQMRELNEIHFGIWQGMTFDEIEKTYPNESHNYFNNPKEYTAWKIGGEDLAEGLERFLEGMNKIANNHKTGNVLVVTHGTVLELFFNYINDKDATDLDERKLIENGEYKIFTFLNGKFVMLDKN